MEIPSKVRIGSVNYKILIDDKTIVLNTQQCKGKIDFEFHKINIDSSIQDKQGQEQTFLHELIHGIVRERNLDLEKDDDETIVDGLAIGLHQVIRDNPSIFIENCVVSYDPYVVKSKNDINISEIAEEVARKISNSLKSYKK